MTTKQCKSCDQHHHLDVFVSHSGWCKPCTTDRARWRHIKATYGLTKIEYQQMLEDQQGKCAICGTTQPANNPDVKSAFSIDHEHDNSRRRGTHDRSKIRGLLCNDCNSAIGLFKEDPTVLSNAINYLKLHTG